jgi:hypothetical protein
MSGTHRRESQVVPVRNRLSKPLRKYSDMAATSFISRTSPPMSLSKILENQDVKSEILCKYFENNYTILNNQTLEQIKQKHKTMDVLKPTSYTPEFLQVSTKKIREIILVNVGLDYEDVVLLKHAIQYSKVKSILLSDIRFVSEKARELFSTIFEDVSVASVVENLLLKKIEIGKFFNSFISSIANLKTLRMLEISRFDIVAFVTEVNEYKDGFDYLLIIVLIKLKRLNELIFTGNNIRESDYDYLFKNFYKYNQGYIIINPELDGMYVKYNMVYYATRKEESNEYSMTIIGINNRDKWGKKAKCTKERSIFFYTKGNYYLTPNVRRKTLPDYENDDFIVEKKNRLVNLLEKQRTSIPTSIDAFRLRLPP